MSGAGQGSDDARGDRAPLRRLERVLRAVPRPADGLHLRVLPRPRRQARAGAGGQARPRVPQARAAARARRCSTSAAAGAAWHLGRPALRRARPRRHALARRRPTGPPRASARGARRTAAGSSTATSATCPPTRVYDKIAADRRDRARGHPELSGLLRAACTRMLKDGGLYLNHGIDHEFHWKRDQPDRLPLPPRLPQRRSRRRSARRSPRWSGPAGRSWTSRACACTTRAPAGTGSERLSARADEARALVGERTYRTWLLYLTCSAVAFEGGSIGLYQVLMRKQWDPRVGYAPRTREPLYERAPA